MADPTVWAQPKFTLTDTDGNPLQQITPADPGSFSCDKGVRSVQGVVFYPWDDDLFDPYDNRIDVSWQVTDTNSVTDTAIGTFVAESGVRVWQAYNDPITGTEAEGYVGTWDFVDLTALLDVPLLTSQGLAQGQLVSPFIEGLLEDAGFLTYDIFDFTVSVAEPYVWEPGRDTTLGAIEDLMAAVGGRFYLDRDGVPTAVPVPAAADATADSTYATSDNILDPPSYGVDPFAPNRFERVGGTDTAPIVGVYDLPAAAPNSYANRGFVVLDRDSTNATTQPAANQAAQAAAVDAAFDADTVDFTTVVAPDTEAWETIDVDGVLFTETGFGWDLVGSATMSHSGGRITP